MAKTKGKRDVGTSSLTLEQVVNLVRDNLKNFDYDQLNIMADTLCWEIMDRDKAQEDMALDNLGQMANDDQKNGFYDL